MKLHVIDTGFFKLDGGAMFGVVPKTIWQRTNSADENNLCTWAMRCLLIETGNRLILIDCGIGNKQSPEFFKHYYLHGEASLSQSIKKAGFSSDDITDLFLTHLHFDHCGGGVKHGVDHTQYELTFKNAIYWSNEHHWLWATEPNAREKASFLKENILPIRESGQLQFIPLQGEAPFSDIEVRFFDGHTDKQMLPFIRYNNKTIVFVADLLPSVGHIPLPYVMGYDTRPLITLQEKEAFLEEAVDQDYIIFFEHDPLHECCTLKRTEKGIRVADIFKLSEIIF